MYIFFLILIIAYLALAAYFGKSEGERLRNKDLTEPERILLYRSSLLTNGASAVVVLLIAAFTSVTLADIGFTAPRWAFDQMPKWVAIAVTVVAIAGAIILLYQTLMSLFNAKYRAEVQIKMEAMKDSRHWYDQVVNGMLPRTRREKRWFALISCAAGFCEELMFRGFCFLVLAAVFPGLGNFWIVLIAGASFGVAHYYQGAYGVLKTALLGMFFGLFYLSTGSLLYCMILHAFVDLSSTFLLKSQENVG